MESIWRSNLSGAENVLAGTSNVQYEGIRIANDKQGAIRTAATSFEERLSNWFGMELTLRRDTEMIRSIAQRLKD